MFVLTSFAEANEGSFVGKNVAHSRHIALSVSDYSHFTSKITAAFLWTSLDPLDVILPSFLNSV